MINTASRMAKKLMLTSIQDSANLEGLGTTFSTVKAILKK